jgi:hypothetical protein
MRRLLTAAVAAVFVLGVFTPALAVNDTPKAGLKEQAAQGQGGEKVKDVFK